MKPGFVPEHRTLPLLLYQPPSPNTQTRPVPWKAERGGNLSILGCKCQPCSTEKHEALPRDLASGYPHPSLELSPTPSGVFTKTWLLSATRILHHHPAPANSLEWGWWTESHWAKVGVCYLADAPSTLPHFSVGGQAILESGTVVDVLRVALVLTSWGTQLVTDRLLASATCF